MTLGEVITVAIALLSLVLSLIVGIPALVRAGRAEALAASAKKRADRIKARETERHDADWEFKFRGGDLTVLEISNTGADDALGVIVIAGIDGVRVFEEREVVRGRGADVVEASFLFLREELARVAKEARALRAQTNGLGSVVLSVTVTVRVHWSSALGAPKSIDSGPRGYKLS